MYVKVVYRFNQEQIRSLIGITTGAGHIFLGATVVPFVFGVDKLYPAVLPSGIILTLACWVTSIVLASWVYD